MRLLGLSILLLLFVTGCGDDRPVTVASYGSDNSQTAASPTADPLAPSSSAASGAADPLVSGTDPLTSGGDPLTKGSRASTSTSSSDPMLGPKMPTQKSHWLDAEMGQARVTVRLNGIRLGGAMAPGVRDITMRLHPGPNTFSVTYEPRDLHSWASVVLTEGENGPSGKLLAVFREAPLADTMTQPDAGTQPPPSVTQSFIFTAQ